MGNDYPLFFFGQYFSKERMFLKNTSNFEGKWGILARDCGLFEDNFKNGFITLDFLAGNR